MPFGDDHFQLLLPPYLVEPEKTRLKEALKQFMPEYRGLQVDYANFYKKYYHNYFMQSDLVKEIRLPFWNAVTGTYTKSYTDAIIVSNTCDISYQNNRDVNPKQCLLAPILDFREYMQDLQKQGYDEPKVKAFEQNVKSQLLTNIFYLPAHFTAGKEYIALLDRIFWFPIGELHSYIGTIEDDRIISLSHYGFYLFILKLSYHLCRLPEQCDREVA
jgi:hypothetical protein